VNEKVAFLRDPALHGKPARETEEDRAKRVEK
jgi:hypothetical protein